MDEKYFDTRTCNLKIKSMRIFRLSVWVLLAKSQNVAGQHDPSILTYRPLHRTTATQQHHKTKPHLHGWALCNGNILVTMLGGSGRTSTVPECFHGGRLWMVQITTGRRLTWVMGTRHSRAWQQRQHFYPLVNTALVMRSRWKRWIKVVLITRPRCNMRGNHDAVTHPRVAITDALFLVQACSQACHEDHQDHQA